MTKEQVPAIDTQKTAVLHNIVKRSNDEALCTIHNNYDIAEGDARLYFHGSPHTQGVTNRGRDIGLAAYSVAPEEVSLTDVEAITFGAGRHDEIQISKPVTVTVTDLHGRERQLVKRQRATGENEERSAEKAREFAEREILPRHLLSEMQVDAALDGIFLTTPGFNTELGTVFQPGFADKPFISQAIALADLAGSGMQGADVALYEAVTLFFEEFIEINRYVTEMPLLDTARRESRIQVSETEAFYHEQLLGWLDNQVRFIRGRQQLVWREIDSLQISENARAVIKNLFRKENYDNSVDAVLTLRNGLTDLSFREGIQQLQAIITAVPEGLQQRLSSNDVDNNY